jgi:hypothetical protein
MATEDSLPIQSAFKQRGLSATAYTYLPLLAAPENLILKRPHASTLFQHYITVTARHLPVAMWMEDTFIAHILPLAHSDDLVLQGVLALSGAHLSFKSTDGDIKQATWTHYALALRGVKHALTRTMSGGDVDMLHLLLTTLLLCQVEVSPLKAWIYPQSCMSSNQLQRISGNLEGNVFHHLRASGALVLMELQQPSNEKEKTLRGFVLELYAYLALVGNITITSEVGQSSLTPFSSHSKV